MWKGRNHNWPSMQPTWSEHTNNSNYIVALIEHGDHPLLSTADIGSKEERKIVLDEEIIKKSHIYHNT